VRKVLLGSLLVHAALAIGVLQFNALKNTTSVSRQVYEVDLVDGVQTANTRSEANVEPAVYQPAPAEGETERDEAPPADKRQPDPRGIDAAKELSKSKAKPDSATIAAHTGQLRVGVGAKDSRFAIDAPPGEAGRDPVGDLEARGSVSQPLHITHSGSYSESYVILRAIKPKYPDHERDRNIEGSVTVELLVNELGMVANAKVLELVGPSSFRESALEAVRQFEFQPPIEDGEPSTMWIKFVIKFRINS
jgi:TonB family protein